MARKDRRIIRAAIVKAAAKRVGCTIKDIFIRATNGITDVVVNLNKIPEYVLAYARKLLKTKIPARPPEKNRQKYFRTAPFMGAC